MRCENCGAICATYDLYCYLCGNKIKIKPINMQKNQKKVTVQLRKQMKANLVLIVIALLLIISIGISIPTKIKLKDRIKNKELQKNNTIISQGINDMETKFLYISNNNISYSEACEILGKNAIKTTNGNMYYSSLGYIKYMPIYIWEFDFNNDDKIDYKIYIEYDKYSKITSKYSKICN